MAKKTAAQKKGRIIVSTTSDPTAIIRRAYILALALIALFTIGGHIVTADITEQQKENAEISYHLGRQRALVQQIMTKASNYYRTNEALDKNFMLQFTKELEQGHTYVTTAITTEKPFEDKTDTALYRIYFRPPFDLNNLIHNFIALVRGYSEFDPKVTDPVQVKVREDLLQQITYQADTVLRTGLDAAFENYQTETVQKIAQYYSIQLSTVILILVVLLAEALFIFRPIISRIRDYNERLQRYALEDSLTGLNNRRAFLNSANMEIARARRDKSAISVALLDLDHFKSINDNYGHEVGDRVLKHFSEIIKESFRTTDIVGRIGGEEFAVVLPKTEQKGAGMIFQRFCETVANSPCDYKDEHGNMAQLSYTVSIGFTCTKKLDNETIDKLLAKADVALYASKEKGRNCVSVDS